MSLVPLPPPEVTGDDKKIVRLNRVRVLGPKRGPVEVFFSCIVSSYGGTKQEEREFDSEDPLFRGLLEELPLEESIVFFQASSEAMRRHRRE